MPKIIDKDKIEVTENNFIFILFSLRTKLEFSIREYEGLINQLTKLFLHKHWSIERYVDRHAEYSYPLEKLTTIAQKIDVVLDDIMQNDYNLVFDWKVNKFSIDKINEKYKHLWPKPRNNKQVGQLLSEAYKKIQRVVALNKITPSIVVELIEEYKRYK